MPEAENVSNGTNVWDASLYNIFLGGGGGGVLHRFLSLAAVEANYANRS